MATVVNKTIDAAGGGPDNYVSFTLAFAALPASIVATDEQWNFVGYNKVGGYAEGLDLPSVTSDATRYINVTCNSGDEYNRATDTGVYLTATRNFDGVITNLTIPYLRLDGIGFKNAGLSSARGFLSSANNCTYTNLYATTADAYQVFDFSSGNACQISGLLSEGGTIGFNFGSFAEYDCNNLTAIDPSSTGFVKSGASRVTELINTLKIGGGSVWGSGTFGGSSDYNATDDATTPTGANSLANRTTADLADYAGNDYRTASGSALATAGDGVLAAYIGYALEVSAGITIEETSESINVVSLDPSISLTGTLTIEESSQAVNIVSFDPTIDFTGSVSITETTEAISISTNDPTITLTPTGSIIITEKVASIGVAGFDPSILLSGTIQVTEVTAAIQIDSNSPIIQIGQLPPANIFTGELKESQFYAQEVEAQTFEGYTKQSVFDGIIKQQSTFIGIRK